MFITYILKSQVSGSYYVGSCEDIATRLKQHNKGFVTSTKRYVPWDLIYTEGYLTLKEARTREKQLKSWKKRSMIEKLIASKI
jgi:putative endonuclease